MTSTKAKSEVAAGFTIPKPERTLVDPAAVDAFVEKPQGRPKRKEPTERLTIYIPRDLAEVVRIHCAKRRRTISDTAAEALRMLMEQHDV